MIYESLHSALKDESYPSLSWHEWVCGPTWCHWVIVPSVFEIQPREVSLETKFEWSLPSCVSRTFCCKSFMWQLESSYQLLLICWKKHMIDLFWRSSSSASFVPWSQMNSKQVFLFCGTSFSSFCDLVYDIWKLPFSLTPVSCPVDKQTSLCSMETGFQPSDGCMKLWVLK